MKSWRFSSFGSIDSLRLEDVPPPSPAEGECLLKVEYAALNPADRLLVMGRYPTSAKPPFSVGRDACGTIAVPARGGRFAAGERVVCLRSTIGIERDGTLAEYVAVPEAHLGRLPQGWSPADGAAGPHSLLTVWQALVETARLSAGETVMITGASGGIGTAALIVAKALGARVIALSRSPEKRARLAALGADHVFGPSEEDLADRLKAGGGADVVVETVCGRFLKTSLAAANPYGRICVIGALGGINVQIDPTEIIFKRLSIHGIHVAQYSDAGVQRAWEEVLDLLAPTGARLPIDSIVPFERVPEAFERLRRGPMGKVVIGPIGARGQATA